MSIPADVILATLGVAALADLLKPPKKKGK